MAPVYEGKLFFFLFWNRAGVVGVRVSGAPEPIGCTVVPDTEDRAAVPFSDT